MIRKTVKSVSMGLVALTLSVPLVAHADTASMEDYLEKGNYEGACLAIRDAGTITAQALSERSRPRSEEEFEAFRTGLFYAAQKTAAEVSNTKGVGNRDRALAAALGLMAADNDLLDTHLDIREQMDMSPEAIGETLGKTCNNFQSEEYKRNLALKILTIYDRLFES